MNCDTGHLVNQDALNLLSKLEQQNYQAVPEELNRAAKYALHGNDSIYISPTSSGKLATWARNKRKQASRKARGK